MSAAGAKKRRAAMIVVLGDVGRSPRMQFHCASLLQHDMHVTLVGYRGEACIDAIEESPLVQKLLFTPPLSGPAWKSLKQRAYLVFGVFKAVALALRLFLALLLSPVRPDFVLLQNPPAIPSLAVAWLACRLRGCAFVVDWHNLGYTMLPHGDSHPIRRLARFYEKFFARGADAHFCVSRAMQEFLKHKFDVTATLLYDRPPDFFERTLPPRAHELFLRLAPQLAPALQRHALANGGNVSNHSVGTGVGTGRSGHGTSISAIEFSGGSGGSSSSAREDEDQTLFTRRHPGGVVEFATPRPALIVSSTSWTPDEDFGILLDALVRLDSAWAGSPEAQRSKNANGANGNATAGAPGTLKAVVIVTGKGPQRRMYERRLADLPLKNIAVATAWLEGKDYPLLLGSSDLGVCLHTSTSGVDLPMKVVDMLGSGLPVCAVSYPALPELVLHGQNGLIFSTAAELASQLQALLADFGPTLRNRSSPDGYSGNGRSASGGGGGTAVSEKSKSDTGAAATVTEEQWDLQELRRNARSVGRWMPNWEKHAWPVFESFSGKGRAGLSGAAMAVLAAAAAVLAVVLLALDCL